MPNNKLLALASELNKAQLIEVTKYSSYKKSLAKVESLDIDSNLALLTVYDDDNFFKTLTPLTIDDDPKLGSNVEAIRIDKLFKVYNEKIFLQDLSISSQSGFVFLPIYDFHINQKFNLGSLLISNNKLNGIISYSNQNNGQAILPSVIKTFIERAKSQDNLNKSFNFKFCYSRF